MGLIHLCGLELAEGDYINMTAISLEQEAETREELNKEEDAMVSGDFRFLAWSYILISCLFLGWLAGTMSLGRVSSPPFLFQEACLTHSQWYLP